MDIKVKIIDIELLPTGEAVITLEDSKIIPFQVSKEYLNLQPVVGGYYTATEGVEGFQNN